ncbi:MAG: gliding motility-associated C-terminal domain-containing protein [Bacteroides sp.]|nr:gliding motility-associated C-terminal domain-containing protein [Bacteroides sp.]MCM1389452.1 gliding motility-associated C-terminal domain-containing protein [Bacteroides sp.]
MNKTSLLFLLMAPPFAFFSQGVQAVPLFIEFKGISHRAITETPDASTGLNAVYVLFETAGASFQFETELNAKVYTFSNLGAAYAQEIETVKNGNTYLVPSIEPNRGYVIETASSTEYIWVVDYSSFIPVINSIDFDKESDCSDVILNISGKVDAIPFYSINGRKSELDRDIEVTYNTVKYNEDIGAFAEKQEIEHLSHIDGRIHIDAPLCNTEFSVSCDRFLKEWGLPEITSVSPYYNAIAVSAFTSAEQMPHDADNEQNEEVDGLGGSAPCDISFHAVVSDAAIFREWQMSKDPEFNDIFFRDNNLDFSHIFQDEGTTYVRFTASNDAATCDYYSPSYEVSIGSSELICPNAFSPGASEGINDIWKVSFKSIVDFECHIFNRWGICVSHFSNPADGWDGKYKGKLVPAGVYFYVIKARGADGKNYNLKGDINIINQKQRLGSTPNPES